MRGADADGLVLHSEVHIGDSLLTIADRKPTWPYTPAFTRVYVADAAATLERAVAHGARIARSARASAQPEHAQAPVAVKFVKHSGHVPWSSFGTRRPYDPTIAKGSLGPASPGDLDAVAMVRGSLAPLMP